MQWTRCVRTGISSRRRRNKRSPRQQPWQYHTNHSQRIFIIVVAIQLFYVFWIWIFKQLLLLIIGIIAARLSHTQILFKWKLFCQIILFFYLKRETNFYFWFFLFILLLKKKNKFLLNYILNDDLVGQLFSKIDILIWLWNEWSNKVFIDKFQITK